MKGKHKCFVFCFGQRKISHSFNLHHLYQTMVLHTLNLDFFVLGLQPAMLGSYLFLTLGLKIIPGTLNGYYAVTWGRPCTVKALYLHYTIILTLFWKLLGSDFIFSVHFIYEMSTVCYYQKT